MDYISRIPSSTIVVYTTYLATFLFHFVDTFRTEAINRLAYLSIIYGKPLKSYGPVLGFVYTSLFTEEFELLGRIESRLKTEDQDFASLKAVYIENCKNTSVAAAIFSSVALTALSQLPEITSVHWAAHFFFLISLLSSVLSVYFGTKTLAELGNLTDARQIRDWFTVSAQRGLGSLGENVIHEFRNKRFFTQVDATLNHGTRMVMSYALLKSFVLDTTERKPSFSTALLLLAPSRLLSQSAKSFLIGLGTYFGCIYTKSLTIASGSGGSLALLVVFIAFTAWKLSLHYFPFTIKNRRNNRLTRWQTLILDVYLGQNTVNTDVDVPRTKDLELALEKWARGGPVPGTDTDVDVLGLTGLELALEKWARGRLVPGYQRQDTPPQSSSSTISDQGQRNEEKVPADQPTPSTAISSIKATTTSVPTVSPAVPDKLTPSFEPLLKAAVEAQQQSAQAMQALLLVYQSNSKTTTSAATNEAPHEQHPSPHAEDAGGHADQDDHNVSAQISIS